MEDIPVVIVCGGQGTRMRGLYLPQKGVGGSGRRPILWHVMRIFSAHGCRRFVLALGYGQDQIRRYFLEYEPMTRDVTMVLGGAGNGRSIPLSQPKQPASLGSLAHRHRSAHGKGQPHRQSGRPSGGGAFFCGLW
ncbi:MAG: hypothetical protein M5U34_35595 [Chloroflexi bacterium]|nr:hypothetical protein [Chloroflexota bacterium]